MSPLTSAGLCSQFGNNQTTAVWNRTCSRHQYGEEQTYSTTHQQLTDTSMERNRPTALHTSNWLTPVWRGTDLQHYTPATDWHWYGEEQTYSTTHQQLTDTGMERNRPTALHTSNWLTPVWRGTDLQHYTAATDWHRYGEEQTYSTTHQQLTVPEESWEPELAVRVDLGGHSLQLGLIQRGQVGLETVGYQRGLAHSVQVLQPYVFPRSGECKSARYHKSVPAAHSASPPAAKSTMLEPSK